MIQLVSFYRRLFRRLTQNIAQCMPLAGAFVTFVEQQPPGIFLWQRNNVPL